jgi:hypothetical protein
MKWRDQRVLPAKLVLLTGRGAMLARQRRLTIETTIRPIAHDARLRGNLPLIVAVDWRWAAKAAAADV